MQRKRLKRTCAETFDFSLDAENRRGLDLYYQHAARLGLIRCSETHRMGRNESRAAKLSGTALARPVSSLSELMATMENNTHKEATWD